ncbi:N,N'-diacetylchitobiose-specific PTS system, EIIA component [Escherichia coli]|uniref:N,N'-diacetylchitobiose-specific PTS system, EIIA component n=1 Tax=Escherichia coli TaxID=562 RepID=A0A376W8G9_ECOLX|nr:N,N'-diacetylchitobiose-specific PTS system, EIIA component [Escherichia coli]
MMDLDNIPDTQTEAEELEEVVMGLSSTPDKRVA